MPIKSGGHLQAILEQAEDEGVEMAARRGYGNKGARGQIRECLEEDLGSD